MDIHLRVQFHLGGRTGTICKLQEDSIALLLLVNREDSLLGSLMRESKLKKFAKTVNFRHIEL